MHARLSFVGNAFRCWRVAAFGSGPGRGAVRGACVPRGDDDGGRCSAPTSLRGSPRGRAAKLAALATRAPLKQSPRVRSTKRASRADPEAALLGAANIAPRHARPAHCAAPRPAAECRSCNVDGVRTEDGAVALEHDDGDCEGAGQGRGRGSGQRPACLPRARLVRSREAQERRPARAARFVLLTRGDCPSGARAASVASFAAGPALRASQGTPAKRGQAPGAPEADRPVSGPSPCPALGLRLRTRKPSARRGAQTPRRAVQQPRS
jgi:hypothetical protein